MQMYDPWSLLWLALAGVGLGIFFFGGLWWTVRRAAASGRPALWFACGLLVRVGATLLCFYGLSAGQWQRILACLIGFMVARAIVLRATRAWDGTATPGPEIQHAP
jgi:F1F0 ATPase subunit 2